MCPAMNGMPLYVIDTPQPIRTSAKIKCSFINISHTCNTVSRLMSPWAAGIRIFPSHRAGSTCTSAERIRTPGCGSDVVKTTMFESLHMCDDAHEPMRNCVGPQLYDSMHIYEPLVHHGAVRCIQGAMKWCVCFQDVLHVP